MGGRAPSAARLLLDRDRDRVVAAYVVDHLSIREIAKQEQYPGATYQMVRAVLRDCGVKLRGRRGQARYERRRQQPAVGLRRVREMGGLSQAELASALGRWQSAVSQVETTEVGRLRVDTAARYVEGCGAHLRVVAVFDEDDDEPVLLYDSIYADLDNEPDVE